MQILSLAVGISWPTSSPTVSGQRTGCCLGSSLSHPPIIYPTELWALPFLPSICEQWVPWPFRGVKSRAPCKRQGLYSRRTLNQLSLFSRAGVSGEEGAAHTSFPSSPSGSESEEDGEPRPRALRLRFFTGSSSSSSSPLLPPRSARSLRLSFSSLSCSRSRRSSSSCSRRLRASSSRLRSSSRRFHSLIRSTSPLSLSLGWKVYQWGPQHTL